MDKILDTLECAENPVMTACDWSACDWITSDWSACDWIASDWSASDWSVCVCPHFLLVSLTIVTLS